MYTFIESLQNRVDIVDMATFIQKAPCLKGFWRVKCLQTVYNLSTMSTNERRNMLIEIILTWVLVVITLALLLAGLWIPLMFGVMDYFNDYECYREETPLWLHILRYRPLRLSLIIHGLVLIPPVMYWALH